MSAAISRTVLSFCYNSQMNTILTIEQRDFDPNAIVGDRNTYMHRQAARAVVTDDEGAIAIMHAAKSGYYKLPGGGVNEGEEILDALHREMAEEIGCKVNVTGEIGIVQEYRDTVPMTQTSYVYTAVVDSEKGQSEFTEKELNEGFEVIWVENINRAIELIESDPDPGDEHGRAFMHTRDAAILRVAKALK